MIYCLLPNIARWPAPMPDQMFWRHTRLAFLWALLVLIACGIPGNKLPELTFLQWLKPDKISHLVMFGVLSFLLIRGFIRQNRYPSLSKNAKVWSVLISISYGALIEVLQTYLFVHRSGDVRDAIANAIGAFVGLWVFNRYFGRKVSINK